MSQASTSAEQEMTYELDGHVGIITLRRPDAMNSLTYTLYNAIEDTVRRSEARALVITGEGDRAFCSGDDVKQLLGGQAKPPADNWLRSRRTGGLTPAADALLHTDIPVIAAVNGYALGWGMELALMADIRVASAENAKFGELFVVRGLCCDAPGLGRLAQLVGRERAAELLFTGETIDAGTAREIGLVSRVVPHAELMATALEIAHKIAANPPLAVRALKSGLRKVLDPDWRDVGEWAIMNIRQLMQSEDSKESVSAFMEKREPKFVGR